MLDSVTHFLTIGLYSVGGLFVARVARWWLAERSRRRKGLA